MKHLRLGRFLGLFFSLYELGLYNLLFGLTMWVTGSWQIEGLGKLWLLVNVAYLAVLVRNRGTAYKDRAIRLDRVVADSLVDIGIHALVFISLNYLLAVASVPTMIFITYYALMLVITPLSNALLRRMVKGYRRRGYNFLRVVIVGTNSTSERLFEELESDTGFGYKVIGFFDNSIKPGFRFTDFYKGNLAQLHEFVKEQAVDQIYYTLSNAENGTMQEVIAVADSTESEFLYVPQIKTSLGRGYTLQSIGAMSVLAGRRNPLKSPLNRSIKRLFDILVSSLFLITVYPFVYVGIAIAIKLTSPGPIYFKQQRTGYRGKSFECLKFRTMKVNAGADSKQATADDPRKTRLGAFLRRTSIDELPQFINVWRGEMSIVGPRPHMLKHTEEYSRLIDRYMARHIVKPGITGWAQVNGYRGITDQLWKMERRVEYDVWYIENWTFLLDLKIIVRTAINAFNGERNAF